jgi:hypothetical protein
MTSSDEFGLLKQDYPGVPILHLEVLHRQLHDISRGGPVYTDFSRDRVLAEVRRLVASSRATRSA